MKKHTEHNVVHLKPEGSLPTSPSSLPTIEALRQALEQIMETERKRVRNEFIRVSYVFLVFLALIMAGGFWFGNEILQQLRHERAVAEQLRQDMLKLMIARTAQLDENRDRRHDLSAALAISSPTPISETQSLVASLEQKNRALSDLVTVQNASMKSMVMDMLKARDVEIDQLHAQVDKSHLTTTRSLRDPPPPSPTAVPSSAPTRLFAKRIGATVGADMTFRLPLPAP